jgi:hypothetical protein
MDDIDVEVFESTVFNLKNEKKSGCIVRRLTVY